MPEERNALSAEVYRRAEALMPWNTEDAVLNGEPSPVWTDEESFIYSRQSRTADGAVRTDFLSVRASDGFARSLFDADVLSEKLGCRYLPFREGTPAEDGFRFTAGGEDYGYDPATETLRRLGPHRQQTSAVSPDGTMEAFVRGSDLWLRRLEDGSVRRLTFDGTPDYAYAGEAEQINTVRDRRAGILPECGVLWNHGSTAFLTYRLDMRGVKELHLIRSFDRVEEEKNRPESGTADIQPETGTADIQPEPGAAGVRSDSGTDSIRPELITYRCSFPGDERTPVAVLFLFDVSSGKMIPLDLPPVPVNRYVLNRRFRIASWLPDDSAFYLTVTGRYDKDGWFFVGDGRTGAVRKVIHEHTDLFLNLMTYGAYSGFGPYMYSNYLTSDGRTVLWQSEREGRARVFRYDAATGECLNPVTPREVIAGIFLYVDEENGWLYYMANDISSFSDPCYHALCRSSFDGERFELLTPEDGEHAVSMAGGRYFTDTWSRVDLPPVTLIRRTDGTKTAELERADVTELLGKGYVMPERFTVTAEDGKTLLYGILVRPAAFDPDRTYPVIDYAYGGVQCTNVPRAFTWKGLEGREMMGGLESFAQAGFAGFILDGRGTPGRGMAFHAACFENLHACAGIRDHIGVRDELKRKFPFLDFTRAGIWGNSGGACAAVRAMLEYHGAYRAAVASAGNHDQRMYDSTWTERYYGPYKEELYRLGDNTALADRLEGRLLLVHGAMDCNVPCSQTLRLSDALIRADKDFDLLILPRADHNVPKDPYFIRRKLDFFVRNLLEAEPPAGYHFRTKKEPGSA